MELFALGDLNERRIHEISFEDQRSVKIMIRENFRTFSIHKVSGT